MSILLRLFFLSLLYKGFFMETLDKTSNSLHFCSLQGISATIISFVHVGAIYALDFQDTLFM